MPTECPQNEKQKHPLNEEKKQNGTRRHTHASSAKKRSRSLRERRILVYSAIGLSVFGCIASLVTGQPTIVVAMNAPLLAIIGSDIFIR